MLDDFESEVRSTERVQAWREHLPHVYADDSSVDYSGESVERAYDKEP